MRKKEDVKRDGPVEVITTALHTEGRTKLKELAYRREIDQDLEEWEPGSTIYSTIPEELVEEMDVLRHIMRAYREIGGWNVTTFDDQVRGYCLVFS